jgi:hypothetical protein
MTLQSALALASGRAAGADLLGRLHLGAVAAYGVRLATFILWRDRLPSFQGRKAASDAKLAGMLLGKARGCLRATMQLPTGLHAPPEPASVPARPGPLLTLFPCLPLPLQKLGMWAGVVPLYTAMFVPAFLNSAASAGAGASAAAKAVSLVSVWQAPALLPQTGNQLLPHPGMPARPPAGWLAGWHRACFHPLPPPSHFPPRANTVPLQYVGAPLMLAALAWEAVADYQQQVHYERQAQASGATKK